MDTHEITKLYKARPGSQAEMRLGQWFCNAHNLTNPRLFYSTSNDECKDIILESGYDTWDRQPLFDYNRKLHQEN